MTSSTLNQSAMPRAWWRAAAEKALLVAPLVALLAYYWRITHFGSQLPGHGDALEYLWAIDWFLDGLRAGEGARLFVPHVFMPEGWSLATFANGLGVFALAVPIAAFSSAAAGFNALVIASFFVAYLGQYRLGRLVAGRGAAVVVALLYVLWGGRWVRIQGHLHILIGSALLPWLVYFLERAIAGGRRWWLWAAAAGVVWAVAISFSLYFIWLGLVPVLGWLLGALAGRRVSLGRAVAGLLLTGVVAVALMSPYLYTYWRNEAEAASFTISQVNLYNFSLDWLPALYPAHPIQALADLSYRQTNGPINESAFAGFGVLVCILALVGLVAGRRTRYWASLVVVAVVGVVLALGPTLFWRGRPVHWEPLRPINEAIWDVGHALKPDIFPGEDALPEFATAVPLPGLALSAVVPFFEGARVPSRYLLVAAPAVLLLAAVGIERLSRRRFGWALMAVLAALLLVEHARLPITGLAAPPPSHPAFDWLAAHPVDPGQSVLDVAPVGGQILTSAIGGDVLVASTLHGQPVIGGGGSVLPMHYIFMLEWFINHRDPIGEDSFPTLLRGYGVRYVLLHMRSADPPALARLAAGSAELAPVECFGPAAGPPWNYPICVLEVMPPTAPIGVYPSYNFSAVEPWGVWAMGTEARARWVATNEEPARFAVEAFPYCVEGQPQTVEFVVDEQVLATHRWDDCEAWQGELVIPAELVELGWNDITLHFGRATRPADHTGGENPDVRELAVGFARFERLSLVYVQTIK